MQRFKVVVFAIVVGSCVFEGEGLPAGDGETASGTSTKIGGGITIEADGTVKGLGPGTNFTVDSLAGPLSVVKLGTIQKAINLDFHRRLKNVYIGQVFSDVIHAQSPFPHDGEINYETAIVFLQMFDTVPAYAITNLKIVCFIMMKLKQAEAKHQKSTVNAVLPEALTTFGGNFNQLSDNDWFTVSGKIHLALKHNKDAARAIVRILTDGFTAFLGLKKPLDGDDNELVTRAVDQTIQFADLIKAKAGK